MQDCIRRKSGISSLFGGVSSYDSVPAFKAIPTAKLFLSTYAQDMISRAILLKGNITSVFGVFPKIDSTKKILNKPSVDIRGTASRVTNVGNVYGGILQCIVTSSETNDSLEKKVEGLIERYRMANVPNPKVLYTDRDCCNQHGPRSNHSLTPGQNFKWALTYGTGKNILEYTFFIFLFLFCAVPIL